MDWGFTYLKRLPFARASVIRKIVPGRPEGCAWCGQNRANGSLFQYGILKDDIGAWAEFQKELFCSISCMRSYHEVKE